MRMNTADQITMDLGRKCGDDVKSAMHRMVVLANDHRGAMISATYGASTAVAALSGAVAAFMGREEGMTPEFMDQVWADILRPIALGELSREQS
jgi:hypothetical protein